MKKAGTAAGGVRHRTGGRRARRTPERYGQTQKTGTAPFGAVPVSLENSVNEVSRSSAAEGRAAVWDARGLGTLNSLLDLCPLAHARAQIIEFRPAHFAPAQGLHADDCGRVHGENLLTADVV